MLKNLIFQLYFCIFFALTINAQTTTINYLTSITNGSCNIYNPPTLNTLGGLLHSSLAGGVTFNSSSGIYLATTPQNFGGVAYYINYNFTPNNQYLIKITAAGSDHYLNLWAAVVTGFGYLHTNSTTACGTDNNVGSYGSSVVGVWQSTIQFPSGNSNQTYTFPQFSISGSTAPYLVIWSSGGDPSLNLSGFYISSITITKIDSTSFTLASKLSSITCGSTTPDTLIVTGSNVPTGATVSYIWNIGNNNGWLYNGSAAPATIPTTTDTLILTPSCGSPLSNVSATANVNGTTNYNTNTVSVSTTQPSLSINGNSSICSGSSNYSINGLPCNASVAWSTSPNGIVSSQTNGNDVTLAKTGNGVIALTAIVSGMCGTNADTLTLPIQVGTLTPTYLDYDYDAGNCYEVNVSTNYFTNATYTWSYYNQAIGALKGLVQSNGGASAKLSLSEGTGTYNIGVTATNSCGTGNIYYVSGYFNCGSGSPKIIKASPNPATSTLNVTITNVDNNTLSANATTSSEATTAQSLVSNSKGVTNMYLYDFNTGQLIKKWNYKENTSSNYSLNVSGVNRGIYVLKMERDNVSASTKVILQ